MAKADPFRPFDPEEVLESLIERDVRRPHLLEWQVPFGKYKGTWSYEQLARTKWGSGYLAKLREIPVQKEVISEWARAQNERAFDAGKPYPYEEDWRGWTDAKTGRRLTIDDVPRGVRPFNVTPKVRLAVDEALRVAEARNKVEEATPKLMDPRRVLKDRLYHLTHTKNLSSIRERGLVPAAKQFVDPAFWKNAYTTKLIPERLSRGRQGPMFTIGRPDLSRLPSHKQPGRLTPLTQFMALLEEAQEMRRSPSEREYLRGGRGASYREEQMRILRRLVKSTGYGELSALRTTPEQVASKIPREELLRLALGEGIPGEIQLRGRIHPKKLEVLRPVGKGRLRWQMLALLALASALGLSIGEGEKGAAA